MSCSNKFLEHGVYGSLRKCTNNLNFEFFDVFSGMEGHCVPYHKWQGRWLARAYQHSRGPKTGTQDRSRSEQRPGGTAVSAAGAASQCEGEKGGILALRYWCRLLQTEPSRLSK